MKRKDISDKELDNLLDQLTNSASGPKDKSVAENNFAQLQGKLSSKIPRKTPVFNILKYLIAAASVAIIFGLSTYLLLNNNHATEMITISTNDSTKDVILPDGSLVVLSHYSSIQYPSDFNSQDRTVVLSGEAYFDVTKNKERPFSVHLGGIDVTVLGTQFNIQSYTNDPCIKTTLIEGKVAISSLDKVTTTTTTILNPNETAYFTKHTGEIYKEVNANAMDELAWKEGKLIFDNKYLVEITIDLSNYFNVPIQIDKQHWETYKMTARFEHKETLEEILNILQTSAYFNWKRENDTIIITANN